MFRTVKSKDITETLQHSVMTLGPHNLRFLHNDVTARSLRAGRAIALLCANIDYHVINMLGRWQSDAMLRYLHLQAQPVMRCVANLMLVGGNFTVQPSHDVPMLAE
jgi:hypothetical protein